jgi:uncharacterized protein YjbJ (UPF0337 family)
MCQRHTSGSPRDASRRRRPAATAGTSENWYLSRRRVRHAVAGYVHLVSNHDTSEEVAGGLAGRLAGKAKQAAGAVLGDDDMAREGRLQEAKVDQEREAAREAAEARQAEGQAELEAERAATEEERRRLETEEATAQREAAAERDRIEQERAAEERARRERAEAAALERSGTAAADATERAAEQQRVREEADAARLEQEARQAEARADMLDPKENS